MTPSPIAGHSSENLQALWEQFVQATSTSYEKSRWLDIFVSEFLTQLKDKQKNIQQILTFCTTGLVGTLLSCELLSDVHQLCQQPGGTRGDDDTQPLRNFLLAGRGSRCLLALHAVGTQGISCGRELAGLLISLYPICLQSTVKDTDVDHRNEFLTLEQDLDLEVIFKSTARCRSKGWSIGSLHPRLSNSSVVSATRFHRKRSSAGSGIVASVSSESEDELGEAEGDLSPLAPTLKIQLNPMDFDYFTSVVRSEDESERRRSERSRHPEDFIHTALESALNTKLSVFELCQLLVSLIRKLCISEPVDSTCQTSVQAINFAIENLCALQFGTTNLSSNKQVAELKYSLVYLLLTALERTLRYSDATNTVMQSGMFPVMLRVVEDAVRKAVPPLEGNSDMEVTQMQNFIYAAVYGCLVLLQTLILQQDRFKDFMDLFRLLCDSQGGHLIENSIAVLLPQNKIINTRTNITRAKKIVNLIGSLVGNLKKVRSETIHARKCKKHRHKLCGVPERFHHQDLVMGRTVGTSCSVATIFSVLIRIAQSCGCTEVETRAARVMAQCGACCCLPPRSLLLPTLELIRKTDTGVRAAAFALLEKVLYSQLGGSGDSSSSCSVCGTQVLRLLFSSTESTTPEDLPTSPRDSGIVQGPNFNWECLEQYRSLLESQDETLSVVVIDHLFKIIPLTSTAVKHALLFKVFYPTFLNQKIKYFDPENDETSKFLMLCCLSVLSSQLSNVSFAEEFISTGGLAHILELILLPEFSKPCCAILEVTVVIELWREGVEEGNKVPTPSLDTLMKALESSSTALITSLQKVVARQQRQQQRAEADRPGESDSGCLTEHTDSSDTNKPPSKNVLVEQLSSAGVFWRACASLVSCSPQFRTHLKSQDLTTQAKRLLQLITRQAVRGPAPGEEDYARGSEAFLTLRLLEVMLTVCLGIESVQDASQESNDDEDNVLGGLHKAVLALKPQSRSHVQALSEVLLRCAATHYFDQQVLPTRSKPELPSPPASVTTGAVSPLEREEGEGASSLDDSYLTADEGYEADVEVPEGAPESTESSLLVGEDAAMSPLLAHQAQCRGGLCSVSRPDLCCLVLNLLVRLHEEHASSLTPGVAHALQRLAALCRDSPHNCVTLAKHGVVATLLSGFATCLRSRDPQQADLQRVILDLVSLLARYAITPKELALYLDFFKAEDPPCEALLWPLVTLSSHSRPQPHFILCFPIEGGDIESRTLSPSAGDAEKLAKELHTKHIESRVPSAWACSAVALPLNTSLGWAPWNTGFSLSLWLRLEGGPFVQGTAAASRATSPRHSTVSCSSESEWGTLGLSNGSSLGSLNLTDESLKSAQLCGGSDKLLHLFSIGGESLTLEAWADATTEHLLVRLCRNSDRAPCEVLAEATTEACFLPRAQWHHLAVNVQDHMKQKRTVVEVTIMVNGWNETKLSLSFSGLLMRKARPTCLLLGHTAATAAKMGIAGSWYLGGVMLFRTPVFTKERATRLAGLGPGTSGLTECEGAKGSPNLIGLLSPRSLASANLDWNTVLDEAGSLKVLQDNLLLTYSAQSCNLVQIYPLVVTSPGTSQPGFRVVASEQRASQQLPLSLPTVCLLEHALEAQHFRGLAAATSLIGGLQVFLVLFARVVELKASEGEQAAALSLLLRLAHADAELFSQLVDSHKLLLRILESPRCQAGPLMLKALLDSCCDRSLMPQTGGELGVSHAIEAVVTNSFLLGTAVNAWRAWNTEALALLFRALHALLRDDHPHREFNTSQLNRARLTETLLLFCKEKFLYEEKEESCHEIPAEVSCSLVELVRSLMGAPPEFSHVVAVADFLLLIHRASATYVTHSRNNFYFLLAPNDKPTPITTPVPPPEPKPEPKPKRPKSITLSQSIDPSKLNKALKNLHIKKRSGGDTDEREPGAKGVDSNRVEEEHRSSVDNHGLSYSNDSGLSLFPVLDQKEQHWEKVAVELELKEGAPELKEGDWQQGEKANAQSLVVEGLLLLLRDTILVLPDSMSHQVLTHVIRTEMLLAIANHPDARVRTAVVRVLGAYLHRATDEEANKFLKMKGFYLLANQLSQFEASAELVEACVSLITKCQASLEDQTELWSLKEMDPLQVASFPPLLAILPRCVLDTALCHNTVFFLREVITRVPQSYRPLLESGLLETLGRTLQAVLHLPLDVSDLCGISEQDLVVGDIFVVFITIMGKALSQPSSHNMQVVCDVLLQLSYVEKRERQRCGWPSRCVKSFRDAQCAVLDGAIDRLQERGSALSQQPFTPRLGKPTAALLANMLTSSSEESGTCAISTHHVQLALAGGPLREVPRGEYNDRVKIVLQKSVEFVLSLECVEGEYRPSEAEAGFSRSLLLLLVRALTSTLEKQQARLRTAWQGAIWAAKDIVRVLTGQVLTLLLSPRQPTRTRLFVMHTLYAESRCKDILAAVLHSNAQVEQRFSVFVRDLTVIGGPHGVSLADSRTCETLLSRLRSWGLLNTVTSDIPGILWSEEVNLLHEGIDRQRISTIKQMEAAQARNVQKQESLSRAVAEAAMQATRATVEAQNGERKAFMEHMKAAHSERMQLRARWHLIVQQLTHERAPWFFPESYPRSWQLDPTEGPARVRNRLQRCHLGIKPKYLMPQYQQKLEAIKKPAPLSFLFEETMGSSDGDCIGHGDSASDVLIERLHTNEKVRHMATAHVVTPAQESAGELLVGETCFYFVPEELDTELGATAWQFEEVREIHSRRFQLQERALEIFLTNGKTYFLAFRSAKDRDDFMQVVSQCSLPNLQPTDALGDVLLLWRDNVISNFEYLSHLNKMAGRSFNDLMQYPVFPFVLADYTSPKLDLKNPAIYRSFERPMAVQDKRNEQHYINTYNYLKQELQNGMSTITLNQEPFHYGSHYSNSGTVLHFLVRMPPFTKMFLSYQDNNFDIPDRTFHSLHTTWRLTSSDSTTDVKEIIPEFFFLPEILLNNEGFSLGIRQSGERVHHVQLPPWCEGDPRRFVLVHRQALESDHVREYLPQWIDLVFGFKQTGKPAVDAINVFHPATYYGFDVESIKDPLERTAWETMVRTYGQTPRQLFKAPHPLVVQTLVPKTKSNTTGAALPFGGAVQNLKWGSYVGSPSEGEPRVSWKNKYRSPVAGLVPLRNNDVFGLAPCTSLLLVHHGGKGSLLGSPAVQGAAIVSWGHADGVVRAKMRKEQPPRPLAQCPSLDPVLLCGSAPDVLQLWFALASGRLLVLRLGMKGGALEPEGEPCQLLGHEGPVLSLAICRAFSVAVSASQDGTAIIWDLNTLTYVRSIPSVGAPVQLVAVSDVSGDIATSCPVGGGSCLRLYTINGALVGTVNCEEQITALCFSCAPEGLAINVIAAGLSTGAVKMWNTWDLTPVRKITCDVLKDPIIRLVYSHDAQHLYASASDGTMVIWETPAARCKTAKFLDLTSL